ncbi:MAG TPA: hypothetical protein VF229_05090 [Burkholderiaceae bacterium]
MTSGKWLRQPGWLTADNRFDNLPLSIFDWHAGKLRYIAARIPVPLHIHANRNEVRAMSRTKGRSSGTAHSWGILLGMAGFPILALLAKAFPGLNVAWGILFVLFVVVTARSAFSYLIPKSPRAGKGVPAPQHHH